MPLDDPFALALPVIHAAPGSTAARYWRPGAVFPQDIRVIRKRPTEEMQLNNSTISVDTEFASIIRADVPQPIAGARLEMVDEKTGTVLERFTIAGRPRLDIEATGWMCELVPA